MDTGSKKYLYADILIAMAYADGNLDETKKELLGDICSNMGLDSETVEKMVLTPRTMDVVESILQDVTDDSFKRCLIKDCSLIAYADGVVVPEENEILTKINSITNVPSDVVEEINAWVKTAIEQQKKAAELFGK